MDVSLYPNSSTTYSWTATVAGSQQTQTCPGSCQGFINYPTGVAQVVRECKQTEAGGQWQDTDLSGCGFSSSALQLCEATKVNVHIWKFLYISVTPLIVFSVCVHSINYNLFYLCKLKSSVELAAVVVNITADTSVLESSAITISSDILYNLTDAAIEEPEVWTMPYINLYIHLYLSFVLQVRDNFLQIIDNVQEAGVEELLESQAKSKSSTK